jgi:hypothetical protein
MRVSHVSADVLYLLRDYGNQREKNSPSIRNVEKPLSLLLLVPYRHGGSWSKKINAWHLNTLMVYL